MIRIDCVVGIKSIILTGSQKSQPLFAGTLLCLPIPELVILVKVLLHVKIIIIKYLSDFFIFYWGSFMPKNSLPTYKKSNHPPPPNMKLKSRIWGCHSGGSRGGGTWAIAPPETPATVQKREARKGKRRGKRKSRKKEERKKKREKIGRKRFFFFKLSLGGWRLGDEM